MRELKNLNNEDAKADGWKILRDLKSEVIGKAIYEQGNHFIMKSTKRFKVPGGWIYNTSTEIYKGENLTAAEALCFVPDLLNSFYIEGKEEEKNITT